VISLKAHGAVLDESLTGGVVIDSFLIIHSGSSPLVSSIYSPWLTLVEAYAPHNMHIIKMYFMEDWVNYFANNYPRTTFKNRM